MPGGEDADVGGLADADDAVVGQRQRQRRHVDGEHRVARGVLAIAHLGDGEGMGEEVINNRCFIKLIKDDYYVT